MTYFSSNGYEIVKLFITQIVMTFFGLVITMATFESTNLMLCASLLAVGLYCAMVYSSMWNIGGKDRIRFDAGRYQKDFFKPLFMGIVANVPNFILSLLNIISYFIDSKGTFHSFSNAATVLLQGYFTGIVRFIDLRGNPFVYAVTPFILIFVTFISYLAGWYNFKIFRLSKKEEQRLKK